MVLLLLLLLLLPPRLPSFSFSSTLTATVVLKMYWDGTLEKLKASSSSPEGNSRRCHPPLEEEVGGGKNDSAALEKSAIKGLLLLPLSPVVATELKDPEAAVDGLKVGG